MALSFDTGAYGQAYQQGQENELTNKYGNLQALERLSQVAMGAQQMGQSKSKAEQDKKLYELQLAEAERKSREARQQEMTLGQLLSQNALSQEVAPQSLLDKIELPQGMGEAAMPQAQQPGGGMIDKFRQFQQGKLRAPQMNMSAQAPDLSAFGLPHEAANMRLSDLKSLGEAKKLFASAGESDYYTPEQTAAVASGDPATLAKAFNGKVPKSAVQQTYNIKNKEGALDLRQQQMDMKEQLRQEKEAMQLGGLKSQADIVINKVDQALKKVGGMSAGGMAGTAGIPFVGQMTGATDLSADIDTIKAILGFSQLTEMRKASPTGGALGQVSDRELKLLTSAVASLDQSQSPEQLRERLGEIKTRYQNWLSAASGVNPDVPGQPSPQPVQDGVKPIIQRNKRTGQQRQSFDGGRTWQPM